MTCTVQLHMRLLARPRPVVAVAAAMVHRLAGSRRHLTVVEDTTLRLQSRSSPPLLVQHMAPSLLLLSFRRVRHTR